MSGLGGHAYAYDTAGNRTTGGLAYDNDNRNTALTYDGNGNPSTRKDAGGTSRSLTYDAENRLLTQASTIVGTYNGDGLRVSKGTGTGMTRFLYDGTLPVVELDSTGTIKAVNTFGANGLVSRWTSAVGDSTFYTFDAQGNVDQRQDASGTLFSQDMPDAFGAYQPSDATDPWGYGAQWGYYTDNETGLVLCTHRFYDPQTGRWVTQDPIGYDGGINLYGYVGNDPVNWIDEMGLSGSHPGGPYHPPVGIRVSCTNADSCPQLQAKMWTIKRMIDSHTGWDRSMPPPRGGNRHATEIAELWSAFAKCQALHAKCNKQPVQCVPQRVRSGVGQWFYDHRYQIGAGVVGVGVVGIIIFTGGTAAPVIIAAGA